MKLDGKTNQELVSLQQEIESNPDNKTTDDVYLFTPKARKQLDEIARQITHNLKEDKIKHGVYVEHGYSGRKGNR